MKQPSGPCPHCGQPHPMKDWGEHVKDCLVKKVKAQNRKDMVQRLKDSPKALENYLSNIERSRGERPW